MGSHRGLVSVIVPYTDVDSGYLDDCLSSLRTQSHAHLEIVLVSSGNAALSTEARRHRAEDWRIRVLKAQRLDLAGATNLGAARATGRYLAFLRPTDRLPPRSLEDLTRAMAEAPADLVIGRVKQIGVVDEQLELTQQRVHTHGRSEADLEALPIAITDLFVGNRLFDIAFWRRAGLAFSDSETWTMSTTMARALVSARRFGVLPAATYELVPRGEGAVFGSTSSSLPRFDEWRSDVDRVLAEIGVPGLADVRTAWLTSVMDVGLVRFLEDVDRATDEQWRHMVDAVSTLSSLLDEDSWSGLRAESRSKLWLALQDARDDLGDLVASRWFEEGNRRTQIRDGKILAEWPTLDRTGELPEHCRVMGESETPLVVSLRRAVWRGSELELEIFVFTRFVDMAGASPTLAVFLVDELTGDRLDVPFTPRSDPAVTRFGADKYQNYDTGLVSVRIDASGLVPGGSAPAAGIVARWELVVDFRFRGVNRSGRVTHVDRQGSAGRLRPQFLGGARLSPQAGAGGGLTVLVEPSPAHLTGLALNGTRLEGSVAYDGVEIEQVRLRGDQGRQAVLGPGSARGHVTFEVSLPTGDKSAVTGRSWTLEAVTRDGRRVPVAWPGDVRPAIDMTGTEYVIHRDEDGTCRVAHLTSHFLVQEVDLRNGSIHVAGRWRGIVPESWSLDLVSPRGHVAGMVHQGTGSAWDVELATTWSEFGLPSTGLPPGPYRLRLGTEGGVPSSTVLLADDSLVERAPFEIATERFRMRVRLENSDHLVIQVQRPLTDDERGPYAQEQLRSRYAESDQPIDDSALYFQSYTGESATDSQRELFEQIRRRRPDLRLHWGIADYSCAVPEGGTAVVLRSRRWYELLASVRCVIINIDQERWFRKRDGQVVVQTFHGYPSKVMGIGLWKSRQLTERRIAAELARTTGNWDVILTPTPEMDHHYREQYRYTGTIISEGYPRDDPLRAPGAPSVRAVTRRRLGIHPEQTAVLYAPTWRDDLATAPRAAAMADHLDPAAAAAALGDDYVLLVRGHRFHAKVPIRKESTSRIVDVTDYPEINNLILASDVALLDYSSLRFDYGQTGKPMIFLVPDADVYAGGLRGFLFDFGDSTPGPWVDTTDEVVQALLALSAVVERHSDDYRRFNETYNYKQDGHAGERVADALLKNWLS